MPFGVYRKLEAHFLIGTYYLELEEYEKAKQSFERLADYQNEISEKTLGIFYKDIGDRYYEIKFLSDALSWYYKGLVLNPALRVKNIIKKIEAQALN